MNRSLDCRLVAAAALAGAVGRFEIPVSTVNANTVFFSGACDERSDELELLTSIF